MPKWVSLVAFGMSIASSAGVCQTSGQSAVPGKPSLATAHRTVKAAPHSANPFASAGAPMPTDDWFSLGPPKEAEIEKEVPGVQIKVHDPQEEDIIVYGIRQKRDFEGASVAPNLTSPQALEAAQPAFVPNMGDSCSYKYGCYDMSQTPLRSAAEGLLGGD